MSKGGQNLRISESRQGAHRRAQARAHQGSRQGQSFATWFSFSLRTVDRPRSLTLTYSHISRHTSTIESPLLSAQVATLTIAISATFRTSALLLKHARRILLPVTHWRALARGGHLFAGWLGVARGRNRESTAAHPVRRGSCYRPRQLAAQSELLEACQSSSPHRQILRSTLKSHALEYDKSRIPEGQPAAGGSVARR